MRFRYRSEAAENKGEKMKKFIAISLSAFIAAVFLSLNMTACGENDGEHSHTYGKWSIVTPADCENTGLRKKTCSACGDVVEEKIPALDHDYVNGKCSRCGEADPDAAASKGLLFRVSADGESYYLSGLGSCTDENLIIPSRNNGKRVISIEYRAFENCDRIKSVTIPKTINKIDSYAFFNCSSITSVTVSNGLQSIGYSAFAMCKSLADVSIPDSVTEVGENAFAGCTALNFNSYGGASYLGNADNPYTALIVTENDEITECTVNAKTKVIASRAFADNRALKKTTLPNGLVTIGVEAFYNCRSLADIKIPDSVSNIGCFAFQDCVTLNKIVIPKGVTRIEKYTFSDCGSLEEVVIPDGVTSIGAGAFKSCSSLTSISIPDSLTEMGFLAFSECDSLTYAEYENACYLGNAQNPYVILIKVKDASVKSCTINVATKVIYGGAFKNCSSLESVTIPVGVKAIGDISFKDCSSLKSVTVPEGVERIGEYAFSGCTALESVVLPDSLKEVAINAFGGCTSLKFNEYSGAEYLGNAQNPHLALIRAKDDSITACTVNENVKIICTKAFSDCKSLESIIIPDGVSAINAKTFYNCSALKSITLPAALSYIGDNALSGCGELTEINFKGTIAQWNDMEKSCMTTTNGVVYPDSPSWNQNTGNYTIRCVDGNIAK